MGSQSGCVQPVGPWLADALACCYLSDSHGGLTLQLDDARDRACLDASSTGCTAVGLDCVGLLVAVDPCPELVSKRQEPLVFASQRQDLEDRVGARRHARAVGFSAGVMESAFTLGAVDRRNEKTRFLLFSRCDHLISLVERPLGAGGRRRWPIRRCTGPRYTQQKSEWSPNHPVELLRKSLGTARECRWHRPSNSRHPWRNLDSNSQRGTWIRRLS
jgi:hypothetical protein